MKQRIITGCAALCVLALVLSYFDTAVLNAAISIISAMAVLEVLHAAKYTDNKLLLGGSLVFSLLIPFFRTKAVLHILPVICYIFILILLITLLNRHRSMHVEQVSFMFFICILIPFSLTTAIYVRDTYGVEVGFYYTIFALMSAWAADTGAYFSGVFFGKHKLAPEISPKKTVEGAIGGALVAMVVVLAFSWLFDVYGTQLFALPIEVNYLRIALVSPVLTGLSIMGDLSASVIKRQYGIKDFGSIMPGHGGIMDRFDSVLLVMPAVYILSKFLPLIRW